MTDIPIPDLLTRLTPSDAIWAVYSAGIDLRPGDEWRLARELKRIIRENQDAYRAVTRDRCRDDA